MRTHPATLALPAGEVRLSRARRDDVAAIVELLHADQLGRSRELPSDGDLGVYLRAFDAIDADHAQSLVVATERGNVVGTFQLSFLPGLSRQGALRAQLEAVRVHDEYRSQGLGTAMIGWGDLRGSPSRLHPDAGHHRQGSHRRASLLRAGRLRRLSRGPEARALRPTQRVSRVGLPEHASRDGGHAEVLLRSRVHARWRQGATTQS